MLSGRALFDASPVTGDYCVGVTASELHACTPVSLGILEFVRLRVSCKGQRDGDVRFEVSDCNFLFSERAPAAAVMRSRNDLLIIINGLKYASAAWTLFLRGDVNASARASTGTQPRRERAACRCTLMPYPYYRPLCKSAG